MAFRTIISIAQSALEADEIPQAPPRPFMKKLFLSLIVLPALAGCSHHYILTLNNGSRIDSPGKPHREGTYYVYKDAHGEKQYIPAARVSEIAPASMAKESKMQFTPSSSSP